MNTTNIDFLERRRTGIGGSDIAAVLGISTFNTSYEIYLSKVEGYNKDLSDNFDVQLGILLEDAVAKLYSKEKEKELFSTGQFKHKKYPYLIANPDRLIVGEKKGLEIKTTKFADRKLWGISGSRIIPENYYMQVAHNMLVLDYDFWDLALLVLGESKLRVYEFERDKEVDEIIIEGATKFWKEHVEKKSPPPIDYCHNGITNFLKQKYNEIYEEIVDLPDELLSLKDQALQSKEEIKKHQTFIETFEAKILGAMKNAKVGRFSDGSYYARSLVKRKGYSVKESEYIQTRYIGNNGR